jgi:hypothetical protein
MYNCIKGCCVVRATNSHGRESRSARPEPLLFHSSSSAIVLPHEAEWNAFQKISENLVGSGIEPGTSGSVATNPDH